MEYSEPSQVSIVSGARFGPIWNELFQFVFWKVGWQSSAVSKIRRPLFVSSESNDKVAKRPNGKSNSLSIPNLCSMPFRVSSFGLLSLLFYGRCCQWSIHFTATGVCDLNAGSHLP
ncbi:hypothetical protein LSTR_LSTR003216 [Laodelphax striatellus]|uniref:Uncharacterized protein n=1 Tax=Laodelphax striatellus TaxID=195883 RepID=A0A482XSL6_LAOST|nr:hypothetical protein LSTR_LSTR003216 [Laodelphax striatellus]